MPEVSSAIHTAVILVPETCCRCGVAFGMSAGLRAARLRDRKEFFCPNGHAQIYAGESEVQRLKSELEYTKADAKREREWRHEAERRVQAQKAATARARNERDQLNARVAVGVCPCCHRTFRQLAMHMKQKHPSFERAKAE